MYVHSGFRGAAERPREGPVYLTGTSPARREEVTGEMETSVIHALVFIQTWGENNELLRVLTRNSHVVSVFHIMGRQSYLIDANFDDKRQMEDWIYLLKSIRLGSGVPAVIAIQSNKVIDVWKQKEQFSLKDYDGMKDKYHMFMMVDNPHGDEKLISVLGKFPIVYSTLHVQGEYSFIVEIITGDYGLFKELLGKIKKVKSVGHIETREVISVPKYRSRILDESGNLVYPQEDIRQLYVL